MHAATTTTRALAATVALLFLAGGADAQNAGSQKQDQHPPLTYTECSVSGGCQQEQKSIVIDSNWAWTHKVGTYKNCFTGNSWDTSLCPDPKTCSQNCALDSGDVAEYESTYGISTDGDALRLNFVTKGQYSSNVGSRTYLLDTDSTYKMFKLKNREFTFTVDVSNLPCGINGALYFSAMQADGGMSEYAGNKAGASYGTGYCDAQCPHDIKFINGEANTQGWNPSPSDPNAGVGHYGTCCTEMDIWEANSQATQLTAHACRDQALSQYRCEGEECGDDATGHRYDGLCDKDGADFNPYRVGDHTFFGMGSDFKVDTSKPITVVTQFITSDGTDTGDLVEIRRFYVQNGVRINNTAATFGGKSYDSITDEFANAEKTAFNDTRSFEPRGGLKQVGKGMEQGMVLVMSLWDDHAVGMVWLDSNDPPTDPATKPGVGRGPCGVNSGDPKTVESQHPGAYVIYSDIRFGEIGSTVPSGPGPAPGPTPSGCPGGSLSACIGLCPSNPASAYKACVQSCTSRCS